jgi:hypothetical protein
MQSVLKTRYHSHENYKQMSLAAQHNTKHHGRSPTLFFSRHRSLKRSNDSPKSSPTGPQTEVKASTSAHASAATTLMLTNHQILLSTAVVQVSNGDGCPTVCRALLDSGSQSNFMIESLAQTIYGIGENVTTWSNLKLLQELNPVSQHTPLNQIRFEGPIVKKN